MFGVLIATSCEKATKEANLTACICYRILSKLPSSSKKLKPIRKDVLLLAHQTSNLVPYFNAWGFFKINHTMISKILGSVATYIIVLIQFNKQ